MMKTSSPLNCDLLAIELSKNETVKRFVIKSLAVVAGR